MKTTHLIALGIVAVLASRAEARPQLTEVDINDDDNDFVMVDGFAFDGAVDRPEIRRPTNAPSEGGRSTTGLPVTRPVQPTGPSTTTAGQSVAQCIRNCRFQMTSEYNPVCGTDQTVYMNPGLLNCTRGCGQNVQPAHLGPCQSNVRG